MLHDNTRPSPGTFFVDAVRRPDAEAAGTAERPFACIQQAVDCAGENARIMLAPGLYRECVRVLPLAGQGGTVEIAGCRLYVSGRARRS